MDKATYDWISNIETQQTFLMNALLKAGILEMDAQGQIRIKEVKPK